MGLVKAVVASCLTLPMWYWVTASFDPPVGEAGLGLYILLMPAVAADLAAAGMVLNSAVKKPESRRSWFLIVPALAAACPWALLCVLLWVQGL